jgi:hypothetical protein
MIQEEIHVSDLEWGRKKKYLGEDDKEDVRR